MLIQLSKNKQKKNHIALNGTNCKFTSFVQPSLLDDHHIGHVGGQDGGSRFLSGRDDFQSKVSFTQPCAGAWRRGPGVYSRLLDGGYLLVKEK